MLFISNILMTEFRLKQEEILAHSYTQTHNVQRKCRIFVLIYHFKTLVFENQAL